jgi:hypothetical protein
MTDLETTIMEKQHANDDRKDVDLKKKSVQLNRLAKHLDSCCLKRETITYLDAANAIGVVAPQRIHQVTQLLEALIEHDHEMGQAIRAALVVSRTNTGLPGDGFFLKAQALGLMSGVSAPVFHQQCLNRLFDV